ncbi:MAG: GNAT family N-acetyltransferase [Thermoplasmata archaeon]|nr:GNAT family N-acetyltransferase [Thermoplasmata archaeon]
MAAPKRSRRASTAGTRLREAVWPSDLKTVRRLFLEYRQWLADHRETTASGERRAQKGLAMIDQQISDLPGDYRPPRGEIILAFARTDLVACGGLRWLGPKIAEIKRIYVRPDHRGPEFGPRLTRALLDRAGELGFERVRVDTLPTMTAAIQFYQEMGFHPVPAYWPHPVPDALFFEYALAKS